MGVFRIHYHAIPYRLPKEPGKADIAAAIGNKTAAPCRIAKLLVGDGDDPYKVLLNRVDKGQPHLSPKKITMPSELKPQSASTDQPPMKVIISVKPKLKDNEVVLEATEAPIKMDPKAWVWQSEYLGLIENSLQGGNFIPAELGNLLQAYVVVRWSTGDHLRITGSKVVAAGVRPIAQVSKVPLPALKRYPPAPGMTTPRIMRRSHHSRCWNSPDKA
jgi:hypothetical protein